MKDLLDYLLKKNSIFVSKVTLIITIVITAHYKHLLKFITILKKYAKLN